jgi:hypothetical protein
MNHLVLVQNEVTYDGKYDHWQDITGVSYQYSNQYRNKIIPNMNFVYYRGVHRANGQQGTAEYFGAGRISRVWRDPSISDNLPRAKWRWYCSIEDYIPFIRPVPAKYEGYYFEAINNPMGWRTSVREITDDSYQKIISLAGLDIIDLETPTGIASLPVDIPLPEIDDVTPIEIMNELDGFLERQNPAHESSPSKIHQTYRRTKRSKQIGDRAENIVLRWLQKKLPPNVAISLRWVAQDSETPGWDIEFIDDGDVVAVEVKGTTGSIFQNVEITDHEWTAAKKMREKYWLILVTSCIGMNPKIILLKDPYSASLDGSLEISPILWSLRRTKN